MNERKQHRTAFTLLEIMIALTIMSVLLSVILIPLRLGFDSLHVGQARSGNQTAIQSTLSDIETDLRKSNYVFANATLPGVTDQQPYVAANLTPPVQPVPPYLRSNSATVIGDVTNSACPFSSSSQWSNTSRIDMIQETRDATGAPVQKIVTYYARRVKFEIGAAKSVYDPIDNPIVLFRSEYPVTSADIDDPRVSASCGSGPGKSFAWLAHNAYGEPNLDSSNVTGAIQTLATPRGLGLVASRAFRVGGGFPDTGALTATTEAPFKPDSSFTCLDTNGDGKIDRVNISLAIASFDAGNNDTLRNNQPSGQSLRAERTVILPNIQ